MSSGHAGRMLPGEKPGIGGPSSNSANQENCRATDPGRELILVWMESGPVAVGWKLNQGN